VRRLDPAALTTVAGLGESGLSGDDGAAIAAQLRSPAGLVADPKSSDRYWIVDTANHRIRLINSGIISTVAGTSQGFSGYGGPATTAKLNAPLAAALDAKGHLLIADTGNSCIRRVNATTSAISTIAGTEAASYTGDGKTATAATLNGPQGVAADAAGNIYISDTGNNVIRRVDATTAVITTVAGTGTAGSTAGSTPTTTQLSGPTKIVAAPSGNLAFADTRNQVVRMLSPGNAVAPPPGKWLAATPACSA
jgi:hypothetical protein